MPTSPKSLDDMPLAAYGGTGMEEEGKLDPTDPLEPAASPGTPAAPALATASSGLTPSAAQPDLELPAPEGEPSTAPRLPSRVIQLFRTSRLAAGAGFAVVIVVGLVLLSGGGASPAATAATPTTGPTATPTIAPPSGDASVTVSGAVSGTFTLTGLSGGQHVDATSVILGWGDATQTTVSIAGPLDRGTRTTDERLVLTIAVLVNGQQITFTSKAGECTIGMAQVGTKVQGSFTCHRLKGPDGKLAIDASGTYRS